MGSSILISSFIELRIITVEIDSTYKHYIIVNILFGHCFRIILELVFYVIIGAFALMGLTDKQRSS